MSTFQQLQDSVANVFGVASSAYITEIKRAINETIFEIDDNNPQAEHLQASSTATTTVGTILVTDALASDYDHTLNSYLIDPTDSKARFPLEFLDRSRWNEERLFDQPNGVPRFYNIWSGAYYIGPPPDKAYTLTHDYYTFNTELTGNSDTTKITDTYPRWEKVILKGAIAKIHAFQRVDDQMIANSAQAYQFELSRFRAWVRRNYDRAQESTRIRGWKEHSFNRNPVLSLLQSQP
tara:strand:+ start:19619 stop:20326 length:708 start_codon:yes stop_codon:yes gene_type:complete